MMLFIVVTALTAVVLQLCPAVPITAGPPPQADTTAACVQPRFSDVILSGSVSQYLLYLEPMIRAAGTSVTS